jgi:hypothetical protein
MTPVGIFKCIHHENHEIRTPSPEPTGADRWDTPTRVFVKVMTRTGRTRHDVEEQLGVPARDQRTILNGPDRRPLPNSAKETSA